MGISTRLPRKLTLRSAARKLVFFLLFLLVFGLACAEIPESIRMRDDVSNDFIVTVSIRGPISFQSDRRHVDNSNAARVFVSLHSASPLTPPLLIGQDFLPLFSIQKK